MSERLILASGSPRRSALLSSLGVRFEVQPADVDESPLSEERAEGLACRLSRLKAEAVARQFPGRCVLAADTVVALSEVDGSEQILGKPDGAEGAVRMLTLLSGRTHYVWTAFTVIHPKEAAALTRAVSTAVTFRLLSEREIRAYAQTGEPLDKAGAYGAQGIGAFAVERVDGSYTNVVGLPLAEVLCELNKLGIWSPEDMNGTIP